MRESLSLALMTVAIQLNLDDRDGEHIDAITKLVAATA